MGAVGNDLPTITLRPAQKPRANTPLSTDFTIMQPERGLKNISRGD
jgi:hypothetical protein